MRFERSGLLMNKYPLPYSVGLLSVFLALPMMFGVGGAYAVDAYTSGFYTRGMEATDFMDRDDSILAPFYQPLPRRWALLPRITVTASYEDNPTLSTDDPEDTTTVYVVPGLMLVYGQRQRNHLYLDGGLIIPVHTQSGDVSEEVSYLLAAGGVFRFGKSSLSSRLGYRQMENVDTLVGARMVRRDYTGSLSGERRVSRKFSVGAMANAIRFDFDDDARYTDYWRYYGAGQVYYQLNPRNDVYLQGGMGQDRMDGSDAAQLGDADFHDVSIGLRGRQTPKTTLAGRLGYRWREARNVDGLSSDHYIAALEASTSPMGVSVFRAEWQADIRPAVSSIGFSTVDQRGTFAVHRRVVTDRLRGQASLFVGQVDYTGPAESGDGRAAEGGVVPVYDGRQDQYWGYSLGLDWWTHYNFSFGISYSYFENDGARNGSGDVQALTSYDSSRWGLRASWNY